MMNKSIRRGVILVAVLGCMVVVTGILLPAIAPTLQMRRECRFDTAIIQTQYVGIAAVQRGLVRYGADSSYQGETWEPDLGSESEWVASVTIKISEDVNRDSNKQGASTQVLTVRAVLTPRSSLDNLHEHAVSKEYRMPIKKPAIKN